MTFRLAQLSDTHLSPTKPYFIPNFDLVSEDLRRRRPDMIVNTGDMSLDGADLDDDLALSRDRHHAIGIDCLMLPGNHDVGDNLEVARRQPVTQERLARYRRIIGADFWRMDVPGWRFIGLNAQILGRDELGDAAQRDAMRSAVADLNGRSLAVFLHKPVADGSYGESLRSNRFLTAEPRAALLACLGGTQPALVLCGHVHQYRDAEIGGVRHIWAPSASFIIGDPWQPGFGTKAVGYLLHEFDADGRHRHALATVRGIVHHDLVDLPEAYGDVRAHGRGNA